MNFKKFCALWPWKIGQGQTYLISLRPYRDTALDKFQLPEINASWTESVDKPKWVNHKSHPIFCPVTFPNRARSPIYKLRWGVIGMHPWTKFQLPALNASWVRAMTSQSGWISKIIVMCPVTLKNMARSTQTLLRRYRTSLDQVSATWVQCFLSESDDKPKWVNFKNYKVLCPVTLKNRARSTIFELCWGLIEIHPWIKFQLPESNASWVRAMTSQSGWILKITKFCALWPWKIGQGQP